MKFLVVLGVALLCLSQVSGEGDILKSLFEEKIQELSHEKRAAIANPEPADPDCNANDLVANGSEIIKNTLDIVQKTFGVAYTFLYPGSSEAKCELAAWRCYIKEFVDTKNNINVVSTDLKTYKDKSSDLVNNIKAYFNKCWGKK